MLIPFVGGVFCGVYIATKCLEYGKKLIDEIEDSSKEINYDQQLRFEWMVNYINELARRGELEEFLKLTFKDNPQYLVKLGIYPAEMLPALQANNINRYNQQQVKPSYNPLAVPNDLTPFKNFIETMENGENAIQKSGNINNPNIATQESQQPQVLEMTMAN